MLTIYCLRIEEDCTYREVVDRLQYNPAVCDVLGIDPENVPEFTTIHRSFDRYVMGVWRTLLRTSAQQLPRSGHAAIDSTFFDRFHASCHYATRADRAVETLKATALVDTALKLSSTCSVRPIGGIYRAWTAGRLANQGFDDLHFRTNSARGIRSLIRHRLSTSTDHAHNVRIDAALYGQRWVSRTVFSTTK